MQANKLITSRKETFVIGIVLFWLFLFALEANAMDINAKDAEAEMGQTQMTLKRVHSGGKDYILHLRWNSATNSWRMESYERDYGYGWRGEAEIPTGTYWAGSAVAGNTLYIIGGSGHWDKISIYNAVANTWTEKTVGSMGFLLRAATVSNSIYIFDTSDPGEPGWIYSLKTQTLSPMAASPPNLEWASQPAVYDGKLYFFGGEGPLNTTWEFNPKTLEFKKKADMPTAGYGSATAVLNGKIYVIGGNYRSNRIEIYDPKTNTWGSNMSFAGLALYGWDAAAPVGSKIAIVEAETGNTYFFNPTTKTLSLQEQMPRVNGDYLTGEGLGGRLYVAGGQCGRQLLNSYKPNPASAAITTWSPMSELEVAAASPPDYKAVEAAHLRSMEQTETGSGCGAVPNRMCR